MMPDDDHPLFWILDVDGRTPKAVPFEQWMKWFGNAPRQVALTMEGKYEVSTVFLGLNHSFSSFSGTPLLFETMIFGGPKQTQGFARYSTWEKAEAGHKAAVRLVKRRKGARKYEAGH